MPAFRYEAVDTGGVTRKGVAWPETLHDAYEAASNATTLTNIYGGLSINYADFYTNFLGPDHNRMFLGQMTPEVQEWELRESKKNVEAGIAAPVRSIAYPVGIRGAFTPDTERIARSLGYTMCFSFYGGINTPAHMQPTNLLRMSTSHDPLLFRAETVLLSRFGRLPY